MNYLLMIIGITAFFLLAFRVARSENGPDFRLKPLLSGNALKLEINRIASECVVYDVRGASLNISLIKRYITRAYRIIGAKIRAGEEAFDFENRIFDAYYNLCTALARVKEASIFQRLPHVGGVPRVYLLCEALVKGLEGSVDESSFASAIKQFNDIAPLCYEEICALPLALDFCILEYVAIFASKSVKINKNIDRAYRDVKKNKLDLSLINYGSYVYGYWQHAKDAQKSELKAFCADNGLDLDDRIDNFLLLQARYSGAMQSAINFLLVKDSKITDKLLINLVPSCQILSQNTSFYQSKLASKYVMAYYLAKRAKKEKISESALAQRIKERAEREQRDIAEEILPCPKGKVFMRVYIAYFVVLSLILSAAVAAVVGKLYILTAVIFFPISLGLLLRLNDTINGKYNDRRYLPRRDFRYINKEQSRTMLVYTALVGDEKEVEGLFESLKTLRVANPDKIFTYSLLLDLPTAKRLNDNRDGAILTRINEEFNKLKENRFSVFVRKRIRTGENEYRGWEKKRGALIELNKFLLSGDQSPFLLRLGKVPSLKYVVTLDSDTVINCATELVEIMEHPYNADKNVVALNMKTNPSTIMTPFASLLCGSVGLNNYSSAMTNPNFDIFGSGNYTGKGIYRLAEFDGAVAGAFMDNRLLSHDFIEGAVAGCANSDVSAIDNFPCDYSSFLKRKIRWLRGDWQLIPYLFFRTRNRSGARVKNPLSPIAKWHILCNIICSLIPISTIGLVLIAVITGQVSYLFPAFALKIFGLLNAVRTSVLRRGSLAKSLLSEAVEIITLPVDAYNSLCAIVVTLVRLARRKNLLAWNVFAHSRGKISFLPTYAVVAFIVLINVVFWQNLYFYLVATLFMSGIVFDLCTCRCFKMQEFSVSERNELQNIAKCTYDYFLAMKEPCDNFQVGLGFAKRTSPTNLGFTLTSHLCAKKLGFIDEKTMTEKLREEIDFITGLVKWNGCLYNWYSSTGEVLEPKYVSTVDNGNLAVCLMMVGEEVEALKSECMEILRGMKLEKLFDGERGLFFVGYNDSAKQMDFAHYDLLASESQLTYQAAISLGKVDKGSFDNLSRKKVRYVGDMLYSWNGGLFEYLMANLLVPYPKYTLLYSSAKNAVFSQIRYAKRNHTFAWGWSESLYNSTDDGGWYQYKPFGLERIAINSQVSTGSVSAYSSIMALGFSPKMVLKNLEVLKSRNMLGELGFFECYDGAPLKSNMTHHQGMILLALTRALDRKAFSLFDGSAFCNASRILLAVEDDGKIAPKKAKIPLARKFAAEKKVFCSHVYPPQYNFLTNGKFCVVDDACGRGYIYFDGKYLTRRTKAEDGVKIYLTVDGQNLGEIFASANSVFYSHKSEFAFENTDISVRCDHVVLPFFNGDLRSFVIKNKSKKRQNIALKVEIELSMTDINKDIAHKTFSQMFIKSEFDTRVDAPIYFRTDENPKLYYSVFFDKSASYSGNFEDGEKFGQLPIPMSKSVFSIQLGAFESTECRFCTIASYDLDYLKSSVALIKSPGFEKRIEGAVYSLKRLNPSVATAQKASLIIHERAFLPNELEDLFNLNYPLLSFVVTGQKSFSRLYYQLSELKKLFAFGLKFNISVVCKEVDGYYKSVSEGVRNIFDALGICTHQNGLCAQIIDFAHPLAKTVINLSLNADFVLQRQVNNELCHSKQILASAKMPDFLVDHKTFCGGFLADGGFLIEKKPPRPWSNVLSNGKFGCIITDSGGGYTFMGNSREEKITVWSNDLVSDAPSESVFFEDERDFWGATANPISKNCDYKTIHYTHKTDFLCNYNGLLSKVTVFIDGKTKFYKITLRSDVDRRIRAMLTANFVMGDSLLNTRNSLEFSYDDGIKVVNQKSGLSAYMQSSEPSDYSFFREGYCDISGTPVTASLKKEGIIPYPALSVAVELKAGQEKVIYFSIGHKTNFEVDEPMANYISNVSIETGIKSLDYLCKWLPHQILSSRFYARAGYYQAGGAIGFRDQLQDALALLYVDPKLVRKHILTCAAHQFEKGDVQHWWHYDCTGVRTTIMDDRLYLPLAVAEYISFTQDKDILLESTPYLNDVVIPRNCSDIYATPGFSTKRATVYEHCIKAIISVLEFGENGLLLMRGGDWNDGMNRVGQNGVGTTVWGSMFAFWVIDKFLPYCTEEDKRILMHAKSDLRESVNSAFNGSWFLRAYTDDGTKLGDMDSKECKIDLITQAFSAISAITSTQNSKVALENAYKLLVDKEGGIIKLLDPPFQEIDAGYISLYPKGVRENGGQYTHGAVWYIWSLFEREMYDTAFELLQMINPAEKCKDGGDGERYKGEPYVIAADVYAGSNIGQTGWTWYTGSASWYYRCIIEQLLGIKIRGETLSISPHLPSAFVSKIKVNYRTKYGVQRIEIDNSGSGEFELWVGRIRYSTPSVKLSAESVKSVVSVKRKSRAT